MFSMGLSSSDTLIDETLYHYGTIYSINVHDYDGDGNKEIALGTERGLDMIGYDMSSVASFPCDIIIGSKRGDGSTIQNSVYSGDLKGDGTEDIIFGAFDKCVYIYNDSDLAGQPEVIYVGGEVLSSILCDYDSDDVLEYVFGTTEGKVEAYSWNGSAFTMEKEADLSQGEDNYIFDIMASDVTGDEHLELIVGAGYEDASDIHFGRAFLLGDDFVEIWSEPYGEYVFDVEVYNGNVVCSSDEVSMLDPDTGAEAWDYEVGDYTLVFIAGQIYAGSQNGMVYSIGENGSLNWGPVDVGSEVNSIYVEDGIVAVAADGLSTYNALTGGLLDSLATSSVVNQVVMVDGEILAGTDDGTLHRMDYDLSALWAGPYHAKDKVLGLDVSDELIATGCADGYLRVYGHDGDLIWDAEHDGKVSAVATYGAYVCCGDYSGRVSCYLNGTLEWSKDYGCQVRGMDIYDIYHDGTPELVVGLGRTGADNIYCYALSTGTASFSAQVPGWAYSIGCGDLDRDTFGEVLVSSTDLHCIDKNGDTLWSKDLGAVTNDAIILENDDYSIVFAVSVSGGSSDLKALNCNGDELWSYIENDEDLLSVCAGDVDGDGKFEVIAGGDNNIFIFDQCGNLKQKDYQFRDVPALDALPLSEENTSVAAFLGSYGVDRYHVGPKVSVLLDARFGEGKMALYIESSQKIPNGPELAFEGTEYDMGPFENGWLSEDITLESGRFALVCTNAIEDEASIEIDLFKGHMDGTSFTFTHSGWGATVEASAYTAGGYCYMASEGDPRLEEGNNIGPVLTLNLDEAIIGNLDSIEIVNTYDEANVPEGMGEEYLGLYHWDADAGRFIECENYIVDTISNTITGTFSSNGTYAVLPKYIEITLQKGWNLVSFCYAPTDDTLDTVLEGYIDNIDYVYRWDSELGTYEYSHYINETLGWQGQFETLGNDNGYWFHTFSPQEFALSGDLAIVDSIDIKAGWNLVCWPNGFEMGISEALQGIQDEVDYIYKWNPVDMGYEYSHYINETLGWQGQFETLEPGVGYWLHSSEDCTWYIP
ncbi:MAG: PQQ-binding-like beta-propeller repeat protein [Candidatus Methanofastidiosa archaeon]|nr:PQQ-binding-like beta-propeller repeat protein [Candidatus Methanofastidiosa archaeon]